MAQQAWVSVPLEVLPLPTAVSTEGFTRVQSVHELSVGRIIVLDVDERIIHVLSADLASVATIGPEGSGPGEFLLPLRLLALGGDSTGIYDSANTMVLVIMPDARATGIVDLRPLAAETRGLAMISPAAADAAGRLYFRASNVTAVRSGTAVSSQGDSTAIVRWTPRGDRDTVAYVRPQPGTRASGPLLPHAEFGVGSDGTVAVPYAEPYHVVVYGPDGPGTGPRIEFEPVALNEQHKQQWRKERERPVPALVVALNRGSNPDAASVVRMIPPFSEPTAWPAVMPPFLADAVRFAPDGTLWVARTSDDPAASIHDVFDRSGRLVRRVRLGSGSRIVGFGRRSVFVVVRNEVDLEFLQCIPRP
jgi:hypothetical protein